MYREYQTLPINQLFVLQILTLVHTFFTVIMSYLKSIEIILLLIALFIAGLFDMSLKNLKSPNLGFLGF